MSNYAYPAPPPMPPPGFYPPQQWARPPKNGAGVAALVLGILALVFSFIPLIGAFVAIPLAIIGLVLGIVGTINASNGRATNKAQSLTGLILSGVAVILAIVIPLALVAGAGPDAVSQAESAAKPADTKKDGAAKAADDAKKDAAAKEADAAKKADDAKKDADAAKEADEAKRADEAKKDRFAGQKDDDVVVEAGASLKFGGAKVTAKKLRSEEDVLGEYLCTAVSYQNDSDEQITYNLLDWSLQNPDGNIVNATITGSDDLLTAGQLVPGGKVKGDVCFDVGGDKPKGQHVVILKALISLSDDRGAWINDL